MKQLIKLTATVPHDRYNMKFDSVYQKDDVIFVLATLSDRGGLGNVGYIDVDEKLVVNTRSDKMLPVVYVMMGVDKQQVDRLIVLRSDYVHHYKIHGEGAMQFVVIDNKEQVKDVLQDAALLYRHKRNKLSSFRLDYASAQPVHLRPTLPIDGSDNLGRFSGGAILNIYPMVRDGELSIVFEAIALQSTCPEKEDLSLVKILTTVAHRLDEGLSLDNEYFLENDKHIYFDANYDGELRRFHSHAVALVMPTEDILSVMRLLNIANIISRIQDISARLGQTYREVLLSRCSVLQCYEEALMTYQEHERIIVNDLPVSMETFLSQPAHRWQTHASAEFLMDIFMRLDTIPRYSLLQIFMREFYPTYGDRIITDPIACFEDKCKIDLRSLLDLAVPCSEREALAMNNEKLLLAMGGVIYRDYFLKTFHQAAAIVLVSQCFDKNAPGGRRYNMTYTEIELLRVAEYAIKPDGRMYIPMKNNPTFRKYYSDETCRLFIECESEFRALAAALDLEFSPDTDFHHELIFTPESTQKLKALGLHITEKYLRSRLAQTSNPHVFYRPQENGIKLTASSEFSPQLL